MTRGWRSSLRDVDTEKPLPALWKEFDSLSKLTDAGYPRREFQHPVGCNGDSYGRTIPWNGSRSWCQDEGHVPLFDRELVPQFARFVAACEMTADQGRAGPCQRCAISHLPAEAMHRLGAKATSC